MKVLVITQVISLIFILTSNVSCNDMDVLIQRIRFWDTYIKRSKLQHGKCFPCLSIRKVNDCDCRNQGSKKDCLEFREAGYKINGLYNVAISTFTHRVVYCDQTTEGGGWTVIQRRIDGSVDFYRKWRDYKEGFGNLNGEFWFGNENIHDHTKDLSKKSSMLIEMKIGGITKIARYSTFLLKDEKSKYELEISGYSGNTTINAMKYHDKAKFSTSDQDNDNHSSKCATNGAWWYKSCYHSNLNGPYTTGKTTGVTWAWPKIFATFSEMKVRRNTV